MQKSKSVAKRQREDAEESKADKAAKKMRLEMRQRGHVVRHSSCRVAVEAEQTSVHGLLCSLVSFMTVMASWHKSHAAAYIKLPTLMPSKLSCAHI